MPHRLQACPSPKRGTGLRGPYIELISGAPPEAPAGCLSANPAPRGCRLRLPALSPQERNVEMPESSPPTFPKLRDRPKSIVKPFTSFPPFPASLTASGTAERPTIPPIKVQTITSDTSPNAQTMPLPEPRKAPHIAPTTIPVIRFRQAFQQVDTTALPTPAKAKTVAGESRKRAVHDRVSRSDVFGGFSN